MRLVDGIRVDVGFGCGCVHFGFGICGMRHMLRIPTLDARCGYDFQLPWLVDCGCGNAVWPWTMWPRNVAGVADNIEAEDDLPLVCQ